MDTPTKPSQEAKTTKPNFFKSSVHLLILALILIVLVIIALHIRQKHQDDNQAKVVPVVNVIKTASLSLSTVNQKPNSGDTVVVSVWEDSGSQPVNAVEANLEYSTSQFDSVVISNKASEFEVLAQTTAKDGKIVIAKGHKGNLTGRQLVATISLKVKATSGKASINFVKGSAVINAVSHQDILGKSTGIDFSIGSN